MPGFAHIGTACIMTVLWAITVAAVSTLVMDLNIYFARVLMGIEGHPNIFYLGLINNLPFKLICIF